jgi:hypothetical protein
MSISENTAVIETTAKWLTSVIIAHNLCPFAKSEWDQQRIRFCVQSADNIEAILMALIDECYLLDNNTAVETSLLIYPNALTNFVDYLDFLAIAEALLIEQGYEGIYQLASFHPEYCFEGSSNADAANYTNRSPYPMLHLLRESSLSHALQFYPHPEMIPENNTRLLRQLGLATMQKLLADCY